MSKEFKTVLLGYDKKEVDEYIAQRQADMEALVADSKEKIKQAQAVAVKANKSLDELQKEFDKLKKSFEKVKKK